MKKTLVFTIILISLVFLFCKEETPIEPQGDLFTFSGKAYSIVDSQKVYMDRVKVFFREDSTLTNSDGSFSFESVPSGEYQVSFAFTTVSDSIKISNQNVIIGKEDFFEEYFLFQYETIVEVYSLRGKVYALENEEKIYLENVNVSILDTTVFTDNLGSFLFTNIPSGEHEVQFNYSSADTIINKTELVVFENQSIYKEIFLYKKKAQLNTELFPLAVGNIWVYMLDDLSKEYWEVIEIEVVDNLISYKMKIANPIKKTYGSKVYTFDMNSGYLNLDGSYKTNLNYTDGNYEVKDSNGNTYLWIDVSSSYQDIFGKNTFTKSHSIQNQEVGASYSFAKEIGIVGRSSAGYLGYGAYHSTLIGAIIDNVEYGDTSYVSYNKELAYYPLATGNQLFYEYTETTSLGDTLRSTYLKREIINNVLLGNDKNYYKIKNTFSDSSAEFFDWQRIDSTYVKLYGYNTIEKSEYLIDKLLNSNINDNNSTYYTSESHMPSILPYDINDFESKYPTEQTKTYYGWSYDSKGNPFNNEAFYEFTKNIGISKIIITLNDESPATIKELNLVGSIINGNVSGTVW